jgi:diguanylate cyclase (GGDEF)-like protein
VISLRRKIDESEHFATGYQALVKVFLSLTAALPKAALPANPDLAAESKEQLERVTAPLKDSPATHQIDQAGKVTLQQFDEICRSNRAAMDERDAAIKDVVVAVSGAISSFKNNGERHNSSLTKVADSFEALSRVSDVNELRRQLSEQVGKLRQSVEEMRRESEEPARRLEAQITSFQQRLDAARKGSGIDRLTGLGSRREAEQQMQKVLKQGRAECVLVFDIEGFRAINNRYGTLFGDKILQALAHLLHSRFPEDGTLFRWGADEFVTIISGPLSMRAEQCRGICAAFAGSRYATFDKGVKNSVSALVVAGIAESKRGDSVDDLYRRARQNLEQNRAGLTQ